MAVISSRGRLTLLAGSDMNVGGLLGALDRPTVPQTLDQDPTLGGKVDNIPYGVILAR